MKPAPYAHAPRLPEGEPLDPRSLLTTTGPLELEIGPGRGGFVFERLEFAPEACVIGLEIRRKWATILDERLRARGFGERARVFAEDARDVLPRFMADCVTRVFVHFPDPWWKKRHHKRLVIADELMRELSRVIVPAGELFVQTDVPERAEAYAEIIERCQAFEPVDGGPWLQENPFGARSPRERRAMKDGLPIWRLAYRRLAPR
jgi:tRNA (guanine-N7-)-methyltransferase